jgi:CheY-like chemotaxis protein
MQYQGAGPEPEAEVQSMRTVLIVEDNPSNMAVFCAVLGCQKYEILEATTAQEAVGACRRHLVPIDLVLCDCKLPDGSGPEVAVQALRSHPDAVILFVSGTPMNEWSDQDLKWLKQLPQGSIDFLEKPFHVSDLETRISLLLRHGAPSMFNA